MKILLIPGHGAGDPGAVGHGYKEADLTREIVTQLKNKLAPYAETSVFDTSKNPYEYFKRNAFNFKAYDYVFEVHFNAFKADAGDGKTKGTEILVHPSEKGVSVEKTIINNIAALGFTNRGVKTRSDLQNMNICKGKQGVSYALLETCFIDDKDDIQLYNAKKPLVITAIANGIIQGFNLVKKAENGKNELVSVSDIVNYLAERGIITNVPLWVEKLAADNNSYWLARKCAEYIDKNCKK